MRSRRRSKFFSSIQFFVLNSLFFFQTFFSLLHFLETSTQETSWDINRGQTSLHIYPWMGSCIFFPPKRRRETSTEGGHLIAFSWDINPRDVVRHRPEEDISTHLPWNGLLQFLEISLLSWVFFSSWKQQEMNI